MANLRDIRRRITSVQKTQQITRAMRMVAAAKLRRAHDAINAARPYAERMQATLGEVASSLPDAEHPLLIAREKVVALELVVMTSDRGLAGAFNAGVIKHAEAILSEREKQRVRVSLTLVGRKATDFFRRRRRGQIALARETGARIRYEDAAEIAAGLARRYESGEVDEVILVSNRFVSAMTQTPMQLPLLPIAAPEGSGEPDALPYSIEPSAAKLLATLVPRALEVAVFQALLENQAGEHAARMTAMENATRNTEELIERLTLEFNRARQAAITKELVEIVTGAQALE